MDTFIKRRFWLLLGLCGLIAALILLLMPAEKTIGQVIKIVYLHGALSRAGMVGFIAAGMLALAYLLQSQQVPWPVRQRHGRLARWSQALLVSGWGFWTAHFVVSMPATRLTWGPWVAWGEPRVTMTLQVIGAGLLVILVSWLLKDLRFASVAALFFAVAFTLLAARTGVLRHPLDPIGASPSTLLRSVYLLLLIPVISGMVLVAWRLALSSPLQQELADREPASDHLEA